MEMYNVIKELGRGTYGTVHLCERKHNKLKLVVKELCTSLAGDELKAAKNEVSILKSLDHPHVIRYYDSFMKNNTVSIVMEYATQGTVHDLIKKKRPDYFEPQFVMNLYCQILSGLHHIHTKKIIHRDLKCENIFLTGLNADTIKIGDFGISKQLVNNHMAKTVIGTCNYLAPELCDGKEYNTKTDIWSLGCILYELCAMEKMFEGNLSTIVKAIYNNKRKMIDDKRFGEQIQELIDMMLQIKPENRPDTAQLMSYPDIFPTLYVLGTNLGCL